MLLGCDVLPVIAGTTILLGIVATIAFAMVLLLAYEHGRRQ